MGIYLGNKAPTYLKRIHRNLDNLEQGVIEKRQKEKNDLVQRTKSNFINMSITEKRNRNETIDKMLSKMVLEQEDIREIQKEMKEYDIFLLESEIIEYIDPSLTSNDNIIINAPTIWYDSQTDEWIVVGWGYWIDDSWKSHLRYWDWFRGGPKINVGGTNAVGIVFYDTENSLGVARQSTFLNLTDLNEWRDDNTYRTPVIGASTIATIIEFQDQIYDPSYYKGRLRWNKSKWKYLGSGFSISTRYNSSFVNFTGTVATIYVHTGGDADIRSFILGEHIGIRLSGDIGWVITSQERTVF